MIFCLFTALTLDSILNQPELKNAYYGIFIQRLDNDKVVYQYNSEKLFIPASNMKLVTTAAALTFLGRGFQYKTRLGYQGKIEDSKLDGNVVLVGGGDPTLSLDCLNKFYNTLYSIGIKTIKGNIIVVDNYFTEERLPVGWSWHYLDAKYAPEISALSINRNVVNVRMNATVTGEYAQVIIEPQTAYVKLHSQMKTKDGNDSIIIYRRPEANIIYVDGAVGAGRKRDIDVAVKDPALYAGVLLKEKLTYMNITTTGTVARDNLLNLDSAGIVMLDSVLSPTMAEIVRETNKESENLYAEILLKTMGNEIIKTGSFQGGVSVIKDFLNKCLVDTTDVSLWDGSGLSKHNLISPHMIAKVLHYMYHDSLFNYYYESFASPGNGTLEYRFDKFQDSLRAKTGAIHAVSCLSGYLRVNGIDYCFSLMFNNYTCNLKKIMVVQERIVTAVADYLRQ